ncbi:MAG: AAA family ATPase [Mariprofundaceae bacterium]|nr:AAA family ATPase [Mariprofundaceae bacterium]
MYLKYWKLSQFPFENVPNEHFFFESQAHRTLLEDLYDAISRQKGAIALTGGIGCGKSTVTQRVLLSLPENRFDIALITYSRLTPVEMLLEVCQQLDITTKSDDRNSLLRGLQAHLAKNASTQKHTVVCIDEAQSIPSLATFEELRLLLNFQLGGHFLMTLVFVGQPELQSKIAKLPQLKQRIALNLSIGQMSDKDSMRYILHRLRAAGSAEPMLTKQAVSLIHKHTQGIPRRINHLMDRCLLLGMRHQCKLINSQLVSAVIQRYPS